MEVSHLSKEQLLKGLDHIRQSPKSEGQLALIVCRPDENKRTVLPVGQLDLDYGLVGDNWKTRGSSRTDDGFGHPDKQLNIMNARAIALMAHDKERWKLAGDQLYIDFDISAENLPAGSKIQIGDAVIKITEIPHNGCKKFRDRFGIAAMQFVNSPEGKSLHLRGVNAKIIEPGVIKEGDSVHKLS